MTTDTLREAVARAIFETWAKASYKHDHPMRWDEALQALAAQDKYPKMSVIVPMCRAEANAALSAIEAAGWRVVKDEPEFQDRVAAAHVPLFHDDPTDLPERRDRFYEEATEAVQALGMTEDEAHQLVAYTFGRPLGEVRKEIGAAALTLASLCVVGGWDMMECAEADLAALCTPEKIAKVRAKRASRHGRGPLPGIDPAAPRLDATVRGEEG